MKKIIFLLFLVSISLKLNAQQPSHVFTKGMGGNGSDGANSIAIDSQGNIYTTGSYQVKADFDPSSDTFNLVAAAAGGTSDIFVSKLDSAGKFIWAKSFGGNKSESGMSLAVDKSGNIYVSGFFTGTADFNPDSSVFNLTSKGDRDIFLLKLNRKGELLWAKSFGGPSLESIGGIALDKLNNIYLTGGYWGSLDLNGTTVLNGGRACYILKFTTNGNFVWAKSVGGPGGGGLGSFGASITLDDSSNIYTTGSFAGDGDFNPNNDTFILSNSGLLDIFVCKLDSAGNFKLAFAFGGTNADNGRGLSVDKMGNIYTTGYFKGTADFDQSLNQFSLTSNGLFDIFVSKHNSKGKFIWAKSFGNSQDDKGQTILLNNDTSIILSGCFYGTVDFDPSVNIMNKTGYSDSYLLNLDSSGKFNWVKIIGYNNSACANGIILDLEKNIYSAGSFNGIADFDPNIGVFNLTAIGTSSSDIFISKLKQGICYETFSTINIGECYSYLSPNGKKTWLISGKYKDTIPNYMGCDSIININLTILKNYSNVYLSDCDSIKINNVKYYFSGTYRDTLQNYNGCDSFITYYLTINKSSSYALNYIACDSIILGNIVYKSSQSFQQKLKNKYGCDSIISINIKIKKTSTSNITKKECTAFNINGKKYTKSGIYYQYFKNYNQCDSILKIDLTIDTTKNIIKRNGDTLISFNQSSSYYQWINCDNGQLLIGDTFKLFKPKVNGNYAVISENGNCFDTSNCININNLNLENMKFSEKIKIYPNPLSGNQLNIYLPSDNTIFIFNIEGKLIYFKYMLKNNNTLLFNEIFENGVYFIRIGNTNFKLILQR